MAISTRDPLDEPLTAGRSDLTWRTIRTEFHQKRSPHVIREAAKQAGLDHRKVTGLVERLVGGGAAPAGADTGRVLDGLWTAAAGRRATFLLAFLLYAECQWAWERVDESELLQETLRAVARSWAAADHDRVPAAERALTDVLARHIEDIAGFVGIENGINCSCPKVVGETAGSALVRTRDRQATLPRDDHSAEATVLRGLLEVHERYALGVARTSAAVFAAVTDAPDSVAQLTAAGKELRRLRGTPLFSEDVYASELRSHQRAMSALADRLSTGTLGDLRLDGLTATYILPFTTRGVSDARLVAALDRLATRAEGLWPRLVDEPDLSDLWNLERTLVLPSGTADQEGRRGRSLILPELRIVDTAGVEHTGFTLEVRLNAAGNHYVRIEGWYPEPTFHLLNQLIRRGTDFMGTERIYVGDHPESFPTLSALAERIAVTLLPRWAGAVGVTGIDPALHAAVDAHVLVVINGATMPDGDGDVREATGADLIEALGPLLAVPAERTATSFEDWVYLPNPSGDAIASVLGDHAPAGSLAVQNTRVTTFYLPGEPDWRMLEFVEMVEFAVSVPALARKWLAEVQDQIDRTIVRNWRQGSSPVEDERRATVEELRLGIARKVAEVRRLQAGLYSVELTRSSAHRAILDRMISATGLDRVITDITARTEQLDMLYDRLGSEQRSKYEWITTRILFVVGLFSFADVIGLVNSLFFTPGVPGVRIAVETGLFVAVTVGLAWWAWSRSRSRIRSRRRRWRPRSSRGAR